MAQSKRLKNNKLLKINSLTVKTSRLRVFVVKNKLSTAPPGQQKTKKGGIKQPHNRSNTAENFRTRKPFNARQNQSIAITKPRDATA
jgi:hypothetical protein